MKLNKRIAVAALGVLAVGGIGAGVANAATTTSPAPSTSVSGTATPGDTADALGGADVQEGDQNGPDVAGAADIPEAGDTAAAPGAVDGGNTQQGDQNTPDAPGAAETADTPGA
ncbi:hypothetical protein RHODO2019_06415 [Rhodococcus antarcticus]|uniref:Small secreted domain DUF320 n=1 Tax=Rhodococcus antarcticus TaxID=2987751 RepID=A0ABY6P409_9NOCA|nr:hypothetical protein [Rhodococcus antarcticus]UZJ26061.1 hypothetical protein RHODO2019_06415 [Rhodococcus antarcticus]